METNKVKVKIYGQEYTIAGEMSKEEIIQVAAHVDMKMQEISEAARAAGAAGGNIAILSAINIASEYFKTLDDMEEIKRLNIQLEKDAQHYVQLWDEAKKSYSDYKEETQQMQVQKEIDESAASRKALCDQAAFLAKNIQDPRIWVTKKGVQYLMLKEGTGVKPKANDKVRVHYVGTLLNGTEFDNSVKRGAPMEFEVSAVIEGWQDLLMDMKVGEKVRAWIPSHLAYGEAGAPPSIPSNSLLVFEVELLQVFPSNN